MEALKNKIEKSLKLYQDFHKYEDDIEIKSVREFDDISDIIRDIEKHEKKIIKKNTAEKNTTEISHDTLFNIWHLLTMISYKVETVAAEIESTPYDPKVLSYANVLAIYSKYKLAMYKIDVSAIEESANIIFENCKWTESEILSYNKEFLILIKKFPFAINLYVYLIQEMLNKGINFGEGLCDSLLHNIEIVKDFIMLESDKLAMNSSSLHKSNPHIKTFGLTPHGPSQSLKELSTELFDKSFKSDGDFESAAKKNNVCIVLMNRIIDKPIEFSLWNLVDWKYAKPFLSGDGVGVNQKMIERFNIIKFATPAKSTKTNKWNFKIEHYGDIDGEYFIVIEKLGHDVYRILDIYNRETDIFKIVGGGKKQTKIHKSNLYDFLEFVKNKGVMADNTRVNEYHRIQENIMLKNMFLPVKFNIAGINIRSQIVESAYLRHELQTKIINRLDEIVKKDYKGGASVKSTRDIGMIIHHPDISNIFNSIIIEQYDIYTFKNKDNVSPFPFSETLNTFLAEIGLMSRNFVRGVHGRFTAAKIDNKIFSAENMTKISYLNKLFVEIIAPVLKKEISDESNIYQSLIYKNSLLRLSLV